jgi:ectoine hydroxylase-related dioxygenase (phytanoyl-CoA dioxygenase family)
MAWQERQEELDRFGFAVERNAVDESWRGRLLALLGSGVGAGEVRHRSGEVFAARGLLSHRPALRAALDASGLTELAATHLGDDAVAIDALFFDKRSAVNWTVPGHQDRSMPLGGASGAVRRIKNGVAYSEPPFDVLASLLALRLHFDDCDLATGALGVVPGTHRELVPEREIAVMTLDRYQPCAARAGDVMLMKPLLLHRSSPSTSSRPRRVLHVVYAPRPLQ